MAKRLSGLFRRSIYGTISSYNTSTTPNNNKPRSERRSGKKHSLLVSDILETVFEFLAQPNEKPFGNLDTETYDSLFSCLLVNREWCRIAVKVLWRQPFYSIDKEAQVRMMDILLHGMNPKLQQPLIDKGIPLRRLATPPAFDYAYFIKHIDFDMFIEMVRSWIASIKTPVKCASFQVAKVLLCHIFNHSKGIERLRLSCFKGHTESLQFYELLLEPEIHCDLIHLRQLELCGFLYNDINILAGLSISCKNVEYLYLGNWCLDSWCRDPNALKEDITVLFKGFKNLRLLEIDSNESFIPIPGQIIEAFCHASCSLRQIRFRCIDFSSKTSRPLYGLASCRQLETLEFIDCDQVGTQILTPLTAESLPHLNLVRIDGNGTKKFEDWVDVVSGQQHHSPPSESWVKLNHRPKWNHNPAYRRCYV